MRGNSVSGEQAPNDAGSILLLALIFVMMVSVALLAIVNMSGDDLLNTTNLKGERGLEFAVDGATTAAVQSVRNSYLGYGNGSRGTSGASCTPQGAPMTINGYTVVVDCTNDRYNPPGPNASAQTRIVTFYACEGTNSDALITSYCTDANRFLQAQVTFDDYASNGTYDCSGPGQIATCGSGEQIDSWVVDGANG